MGLLRIGFFGSDHFSINCLRRLLPLYENRSHISSLEIITRSPKLGGRGMKEYKDVEIATFAKDHDIPLLRADRKDEFDELTKRNYNMAIAVSYGIMIPNQFLQSLQFGGLNVHPSLLPRYSGPAPLYRTLLNNDKVTGCTIQALHPTKFDRGDIFLQEKYTIKENETLQSLSNTLSTLGGDLLRKTLENRIFDPKSENYQVIKPEYEFSYAAKMKSFENQINWNVHNSSDIVKRFNTLGPLYCFIDNRPKRNKSTIDPNLLVKRVILNNIKAYLIQPNSSTPHPNLVEPGQFQLDGENLIIKSTDGYIVSDSIKLEGFGYEPPKIFVDTLKRKTGLLSSKFN